MKVTIHGVFLLLFSVFQATWLDCIEIFGVKPNLFLVYLITICCFCSKTEGMTLGAVLGLLLDLLIGRFWGLNAVLGAITGFFLAGFCEGVLRNNNIFIVLLLAFFGSVIYEAIYGFVSFVFGTDMRLGFKLVRFILPEALYNVFAAFVLYFPIKKFTKLLYVDKGEIIG